MQSNVLQPLNINGADSDFATELCSALLATCNADNASRQQAENWMKQAQSQQGCVANLLQIATSQEVSRRSRLQICPLVQTFRLLN